MKEGPRKHGDRYDVSGNVEAQYVDPAGLVMVNKRGITDLPTLQDVEREALARAYETLLREVRADTPMTCDLLRHIHREVFGALYEWAGRWRTVWISKPGMTWPAPDFLEQHMAAQTSRPLLAYDQTGAGQQQYLGAALAAFKKDHRPMSEVIRSSLIEARQR